MQDQEEEECLERMRERQRKNNEQQHLSLVYTQPVCLPSLLNNVKFLGPTCIPKCGKDQRDCNHYVEVHLKQ